MNYENELNAKELEKDTDCDILKYQGETVMDTGIGTITGDVATASNGLFSQVVISAASRLI